MYLCLVLLFCFYFATKANGDGGCPFSKDHHEKSDCPFAKKGKGDGKCPYSNFDSPHYEGRCPHAKEGHNCPFADGNCPFSDKEFKRPAGDCPFADGKCPYSKHGHSHKAGDDHCPFAHDGHYCPFADHHCPFSKGHHPLKDYANHCPYHYDERSSHSHHNHYASTERAEKYRTIVHGFNAKLNNLEHFKKTGAIDEHTRSRFLVGDESQYDSISGFDDLIAVNAKFFPEGSDAKLTVNNYFENLDGSLGHGSFYYSRTVKGKKNTFSWNPFTSLGWK